MTYTREELLQTIINRLQNENNLLRQENMALRGHVKQLNTMLDNANYAIDVATVALRESNNLYQQERSKRLLAARDLRQVKRDLRHAQRALEQVAAMNDTCIALGLPPVARLYVEN